MEVQLETEGDVPEADLKEFVDRMQSIGVERTTPQWAAHWRDHADARRKAHEEENERHRQSAGSSGAVPFQRGIDPTADEGEPEESFEQFCDRKDAEEAEDVVDGIVGDGQEGRQVRTRIAAYVPTPTERKLHNVTHYPFRSWCACCVAGRAPAAPHYRGGDKEIPEGG